MLKASEFCNAQNECVTLLESLDMTTEYASKLIGFISWANVTDDDEITQMQPMAEEHFNNLVKVAKQLSSYAYRFNNKLKECKEVIDQIDC
jgi:hypothetical protein